MTEPTDGMWAEKTYDVYMLIYDTVPWQETYLLMQLKFS